MCCGFFTHGIRVYLSVAIITFQLIPHSIVVIFMHRSLECMYIPKVNNLVYMFGYIAYFYRKECVNLTDVNFPPGFIAPGPDRYVYYEEYNTLTPEGSPSRITWQLGGYDWLDRYKDKDESNDTLSNETEPNDTMPVHFHDGKIRKYIGVFPMLRHLFTPEKPNFTQIMTFTKKDFQNARSKTFFLWNFHPNELQTTSPKSRTLWKKLAEWKLNKLNQAFPRVLKKYQRKEKRFVLFTLDKNLIKTYQEVHGSTTSPLENIQSNLRDQISINLKFTIQEPSVEGPLSITAPTLTYQLPKPTFGQKFIKLLNKYTQPVPSPTYQKTEELTAKKVISEPLTTISNLMESLISPAQKRLVVTMPDFGIFSLENQNGTDVASKSSETLTDGSGSDFLRTLTSEVLTDGSSSEFLRTPNRFIKLLNKFRQPPETVVRPYRTESSGAFQTQLYPTEPMIVVTRFPSRLLESATKKTATVVPSFAFQTTKSRTDLQKTKNLSSGPESGKFSFGSTQEFSVVPNKFIKLLNKFTQDLPVVQISTFLSSALQKANFTPTPISVGPTKLTQNLKFVKLLNKFTKEIPVVWISVTFGTTGKSTQNFKFVKLINKFTRKKTTMMGPVLKFSPVFDKSSVAEIPLVIKNQSHPTKDGSFVLETELEVSKSPLQKPQVILKKPQGKPKDTKKKFAKLLKKFTQKVLPKKTVLPILNLTGVTNLSMEIKKIQAKIKGWKKYHGKLSKKKFAKLLKKFPTREIPVGIFTRYLIPNQTETLLNFTGSLPAKPRKGKKYRGKPKDPKKKFAKLLKKLTQQLPTVGGKFSIPDSSGGSIGTPSGSTRSLRKAHGKRKPAKKMFVKLLKKFTRDLATRENGTYPKSQSGKHPHVSSLGVSGFWNDSTRRGRSKNPKKIFAKLLKKLTQVPQNFTGVSRSVPGKSKKSKKGGKKSRGKFKNPKKVFAKVLKKYRRPLDDSTDYVDIPVHLIPNRTEAPKFLAKPLIPFLISSRFKKHLNKTESQYLMNHILHYAKHLNPDFWDEEKIDMLLGLISPINWIVLCLNFMYGETRNSSLENILTKAPFILWPSWVKLPRQPRQYRPPDEYTMREWWTYKGRTIPYWWQHLQNRRGPAQQKLMPYHIMWPKFSPNYIWVRDWVIAWLIMDLLWAITTGLMMFGVICRVNGPFSTFFYSPFLLVTFFIIVMDVVCAGYFGVTITTSMNFWDYLTFAGVRNVEQLKNSDKAWFPDYKQTYFHASWLITIFFLRFGVFWIINVNIFWTVVYVFRDVLARKTMVTEVRILNPCDPKFKVGDESEDTEDTEDEKEVDDDSEND